MSRILLIDDEELLRSSVAAYLEDDGYDVLAVENAESALSKIRQYQPEVVVVDLRLKGASGEDFIKAAERLMPGLRYIIHTGSKDYSLPQSLQDLGIRESQLMFKPIDDLSKLSQLINRLLPKSSNSAA